ncbi:hypothetical protein SBBP2_890031 [Burkholderiales bacterium]|nr:hypothetical protein SBBP2_890031 [Burkholderiales bacterium]
MPTYNPLNPPRLFIQSGLYELTPLDTQSSRSAPNIWLYQNSTDSSTDISATTGYFTGCGRAVPVSGAYIPINAGGIGMKVGDVVLSIPGASATTPRATWLTVTASTMSVSTTSSTWAGSVVWNVSATT